MNLVTRTVNISASEQSRRPQNHREKGTPMSNPENEEEILRSHEGLIKRVIIHCNNPGSVPDLEQILQMAEQNDWTDLVAVIRDIMSGNRDETLLSGLDDEERVIIEAILNSLKQGPISISGVRANYDSEHAGPGIASLIHASQAGDANAVEVFTNVTRQMAEEGGDLTVLASRLQLMLGGERNEETLCQQMDGKNLQLMQDILSELRNLETN